MANLKNISKRVQSLIGLGALIAAVPLFYQNCAKSADLSQYNTSSSTSGVGPTACIAPAQLSWNVGTSICYTTGGMTITSGATVALTAAAPASGAASITCNNGTIAVNGTPTCQLNCVEPATLTWPDATQPTNVCSAPGGATINDGANSVVTAVAPNTGGAEFTCTSGVISVSANTCVAAAPVTLLSCTFNGTTIASGSTVTAYSVPSASNALGNFCRFSKEIRTCTNGVLSGSFTYSTCNDIVCSGKSCFL